MADLYKVRRNLPGLAQREATVGPVSNENGVLGVTFSDSAGERTQRALTVANNVVVDVRVATGGNIGSQAGSAIKIAQQIAAKVST